MCAFDFVIITRRRARNYRINNTDASSRNLVFSIFLQNYYKTPAHIKKKSVGTSYFKLKLKIPIALWFIKHIISLYGVLEWADLDDIVVKVFSNRAGPTTESRAVPRVFYDRCS